MDVARRWADAKFAAPLLAFVGLFAILPVLALFAAALSSGGAGGVARVIGDPLDRQAFLNSAEQGALSALGAVAAGAPLGILLGRYSWPGRSLVRAMMIVPFLLPSLVMVVGITALVGPQGTLSGAWPALGWFGTGVPAIVAVNVLFNLPLVALLTASGTESCSSAELETAATLGAAPTRQFRDVWGRPTLTGTAAGALLTFVFSALSFAPPILLCGPRCYTLEARVYALDQVLLDPTGAAILALLMVGLLLAPVVAYLLLLRRLARPRASGAYAPPPLRLRDPAAVALLAPSTVVLGVVLLLVGGIVLRGIDAAAPGGSPGSAWPYLASVALSSRLGISTGGALLNSLGFAAAATGVALLVGVVGSAGRRNRGLLLPAYRWVPLLVSPVVLAFAIGEFWEPILGGPADVGLLIILAQGTLAIPFALAGLDVALSAVPDRYRETASTIGAPPFTAYVEAELPLARPALVTAGLLAFALSLGEFTATNFLATPASTTIPVELYWLSEHRAGGAAVALAAVLVVVAVVAFLALERGRTRVLV